MATQIILSSGKWVNVPEGADPDFFRRIQETGVKLAASPRKQKSTKRNGKPKKSVNYAEQVLWRGVSL